MDSNGVISITEQDTKSSIQTKVWDYLEITDFACFPRPVHNRIPNFKGAALAADKVASLECFKKALTIKVNPDKAQQHSRFLVLQSNKDLLVPTPRLKFGLFNKIIPPKGANKEKLRICSSSEGVRKFSVPIGLEDKVKIDLIIIGSVAVSKKGYRIGKGEGYADLEYAMMTRMGAVDSSTIVITTVHDCQVFKFLSEDLFQPYDVSADYIVAPTRIIKCDGAIPKPRGIIWSLLDEKKYNEIPILKILRHQEMKSGKDVVLRKGS